MAKKYKNQHGYTMAEFAPTLFLAFLIVGLPMLAFGTIAMRYIFLFNAARLAVQAASRTESFLANTSATQISAVNTANSVANSTIGGISGGSVKLTSVTTYIEVCPIGGTYAQITSPGANTPLAQPANPQSNTYDCQVILVGTLQPLFPGGVSMLGKIQGFNAPIQTSARADCFFENSGNLNQ